MKNKELVSCMQGVVKRLEESKDHVFAQGLSGEGFIIKPSSNRIVAPFDGQVVIVFDTKHAIILRSEEGLALVIHVGVDVSKLSNEGFKVYVKDGATIEQGDLLLEMDFSYLKAINYDIDTHILFPSLGLHQLKNIQYGKTSFLEKICEIE